MDHPTVDLLVKGLGAAFEAGLDLYNRWLESQHARNHYHRRPPTAGVALKCALGASYDVSTHRIRATYQVAFAIIGLEFSVGDDTCRTCLTAHLRELELSVQQLADDLAAAHASPVGLGSALRTSELVRIQCVSALVESYRRFSAGRPIPQDLPIPKPRRTHVAANQPPPPSSQPSSNTAVHGGIGQDIAVWSLNSVQHAVSEPPSPPPTPKTNPDHAPETEGRHPTGPRNGVFSIFCPHAMLLQVDPARRPDNSKKQCDCGFPWDPPGLSSEAESIPLKHGFRLTKRFLAKSHCRNTPKTETSSGSAGDPSMSGYGCVFCTSTGRTDTYASIDSLRLHIDASHTKWQMLHDHDLASLGS